jgi:hypothetical protein
MGGVLLAGREKARGCAGLAAAAELACWAVSWADAREQVGEGWATWAKS